MPASTGKMEISVFGSEDSVIERLAFEQVPELADLVGDLFSTELTAEESGPVDDVVAEPPPVTTTTGERSGNTGRRTLRG